MAKISAHGDVVGTIYFLTSAKRYMSDGHILKNAGFGWKLHAKIKVGIAPAYAFDRAKARQVDDKALNPAFHAYKIALHDICGLAKRWRVHSAITAMPDDYDGVWSTVCDTYSHESISADVDEIATLCRLYSAAIAERQASSNSPVAA